MTPAPGSANGLIIGLVGEIRAGKSTVAGYLVREYSAVWLRNSDILRSALDLFGIPATRANFATMAKALFDAFGYDLIPRARMPAVEAHLFGEHTSPRRIVVIDGLRYREELAHWRLFAEFRLLHVSAPADVRVDRRSGPDAKLGEEQLLLDDFLRQQVDPGDALVPEIAAQADWSVDNSGAIGALQAQVDAIMGGLIDRS